MQRNLARSKLGWQSFLSCPTVAKHGSICPVLGQTEAEPPGWAGLAQNRTSLTHSKFRLALSPDLVLNVLNLD
jgi:hypothetical protein